MDNQEQTNNNPYVKAIDTAMEQMRLEYKTLYGTTFFELDSKVSEALNEGWQPAGPQYQAKGKATDGWFLQPMIRVPRPPMAR